MSIHMVNEIEKLKKKILSMSSLVEQILNLAVRSAVQNDLELAQRVLAMDNDVDAAELDVEEECLKILALYQPVATDLRYVVAVLKINSDLERVGDLSANIASNAVHIVDEPVAEIPFDIRAMTETVTGMLHDTLESFVNLDSRLAQTVIDRDADVDRFKRDVFEGAKARMRQQAGEIPGLVRLINIGRELDRIGDLTTNIAEDILYLIRGYIVRHPRLKNNPGHL